MNKLLTILAASVLVVVPATAAPISGFEALYDANYAACVLPDGTEAACEAAINAHVAALLDANVSEDEANTSFTALRAEVFAANESDEDFQEIIDALFELLLPNSGAIGVGQDVLTPAASDGGGGDVEVSGT